MDIDTFLRRLRGTLGTALIWGGAGVALAVVAATLFALLSVVGIIPGGVSLLEVMVLVVRLGLAGAVAGVGFSAFVALLSRGRRLSDLSWVKFGIGGGLAVGLVVPLFLQLMNLLGGEGLVAWNLVLDDALLMTVLGGTAAGGSLKLAQVAEKLLPPEEQDPTPELGDGG